MPESSDWSCSGSGCWEGYDLFRTGPTLRVSLSLSSDQLLSLDHLGRSLSECALCYHPLLCPGQFWFVPVGLVSHVSTLSSVLVCLLNALVTLLIKCSVGTSNLHFKPRFTVCNAIFAWLFNSDWLSPDHASREGWSCVCVVIIVSRGPSPGPGTQRAPQLFVVAEESSRAG